jgi:putative DNA primase/helicase
MMLPKTIEQAEGKWRGILSQFGLTDKHLSGKHTDCPMCGGKDRWRFDDKKGSGSYYCNGCGAGYGMDLLKKVTGMEFKDAAKAVDQIVGTVKAEQPKKEKSTEEIRADIKRIMAGTNRVDAMGYLSSRGIQSKPDVRFHPALEYFENGKLTGEHPAMIGMVLDAAGKGVAIHRTYLKQGGKADVESPRKMSSALAPLVGCAIRLYPITGEILGVAEGIETACSAHQLFEIPVWSCINTTLLESFNPPEGIKSVVIFGDHDANFAGQKSAYALAHRLAMKGFSVDVRIPELPGDWND